MLYKIHVYFKMALLSLSLNRLRSILSILGIVFGVMAVIVIISVGEGVKNEALRQIEQLGTRNVYIRSVEVTDEKKVAASQNHRFGLALGDVNRIESGCTAVGNAAALKTLKVAVIGAPKEISPQVVSITPSYGEVLDLKLRSGRFIIPKDRAGLKEVCVIGHDISKALGKEGRIGAILRIENHLFKIVGILDRYRTNDEDTGTITARNYNEMVLLPLGVGAWLKRDTNPQDKSEMQCLTELIIAMDAPEHVLDSALVIKRIMENIHPEVQAYQIITPMELLNQARKTKKMFSLFLVTIASISLLVGGIGIMNIMLATVSERKREIGIRRAVGAKKKHILIQFLAESSILTLSGGVMGIGLGLVTILIISFFIPWESSITVEAVIIPLIISSVIGLFSGIYPAYSAAAMDPILALGGG